MILGEIDLASLITDSSPLNVQSSMSTLNPFSRRVDARYPNPRGGSRNLDLSKRGFVNGYIKITSFKSK